MPKDKNRGSSTAKQNSSQQELLPHPQDTGQLLSVSTSFRMISEADYSSLLQARNENFMLREQIAAMTGRMTELNATISRNNDELDTLRKENAMLRETIKEMQIKINGQDTKIERLEDERLLKNYRMLIQDLNEEYKIQNRLKYPYNNGLKDLKDSRNTEFHVLENDDTQDTVGYKTYVGLQKIYDMPKKIKHRLERKCPQLIDEFARCIKTLPLNYNSLSDEEKKYIDEDFEYLFN